MVVTVLEARVDSAKDTGLVRRFQAAVKDLPSPIVESFLLHAVDDDVRRIVTVWRSREDLEGYRAFVETPEGVRMFRDVGAEPALTVFKAAAHAVNEADSSAGS